LPPQLQSLHRLTRTIDKLSIELFEIFLFDGFLKKGHGWKGFSFKLKDNKNGRVRCSVRASGRERRSPPVRTDRECLLNYQQAVFVFSHLFRKLLVCNLIYAHHHIVMANILCMLENILKYF
jgi:hypothetical protein